MCWSHPSASGLWTLITSFSHRALTTHCRGARSSVVQLQTSRGSLAHHDSRLELESARVLVLRAFMYSTAHEEPHRIELPQPARNSWIVNQLGIVGDALDVVFSSGPWACIMRLRCALLPSCWSRQRSSSPLICTPSSGAGVNPRGGFASDLHSMIDGFRWCHSVLASPC